MMMKAFAEFIMRGRREAIFVTVVAVLILPIISGAAIALVTLRRGTLEGSWLLIFVLAALLIVWNLAWISVPEVVIVVSLLATTYLASMVLRITVRWLPTLWVMLGLSAILAISIFYGFPEVPKALNAMLEQFISQLQQAAIENAGSQAPAQLPQVEPLGTLNWAALVAYGSAVTSLLSLSLARWWQALLYNPGGFRHEFAQIRLSQVQALVCMGLATVSLVLPEWRLWKDVAILPLVVASVAMAHQFAASQGLGRVWLVVFYLALLFEPFRLGMALLSFADAFIDLRRRLNSKTRPPLDKDDR